MCRRAALLAVLLLAAHAPAADYYWNPAVPSANWTGTTNWGTTPGTYDTTWVNGNTANFTGTGQTIIVNNPTFPPFSINVSGINFTGDNTTIARGGFTDLYFRNVSTATINVSGTNSATIAATLSANSITKSGTGTLTLSGFNNSIYGTLAVTAGTLRVSSQGSAWGRPDDTTLLVAAGAVADLNGLDIYLGTLGDGSAGTITNSAAGTGTLNLNRVFSTTTFAGAIQDGAGAIALGLNGGNVGVFTLSGTSNTYSGTTTPNNVTFRAGAAGAFSPNSQLSLGTNATVRLNGFDQTVAGITGVFGVIENGGAANATLTTGGNNASTTYSSTIQDGAGGGTLALTKVGTGTLTLDGVNTYTGRTTIAGGVLSVTGLADAGSASNIGGGTAITLSGGGTLRYANTTTDGSTDRTVTVDASGGTIDVPTAARSLTLSGAVSGGSLTKSGTGTLALSGAADNAGLGVTVSGGTLLLAKTSSTTPDVHAVGGGGLTVNAGGTARLGGSGGDQIWDGAGLTVNAGGTFDLNGRSETFATLNGTGTVTNAGGGAGTLTVGGGTFDGGLGDGTGTLAVVKQGAGVLVLSGTNTYTGGTTVSGGTLALAGDNSTAVGAITVGSGATLRLDRNDTFGNHATATGPDVTVSGGTVTNSGGYINALQNLTLNGGSLSAVGGFGVYGSYSVRNTLTSTGASSISLGTGALALSFAGTTTFDVQSGTLTVSSPVTDNVSPTPGGLTKTGAGTLTLSGASTYTGATTVSGGSLRVNGSLGATAVAVNGGTLGGTGTLGGSLTVNGGGTLAPGNSIGTLVVNSDLTVASGATFEAELGAGTSADLVDLSGGSHTLNLANGSTVNLVSSGFTRPATPTTFTLADLQSDGASLLQLNGVNLAAGTDVTVYTADGLGGGSFSTVTGSVNLTATGFNLTAGDRLTLRRSAGGDLVVVFTPVPEPGTVLLGGVGVLGLVRLLRFARRRRSQAV